MRPHAAALVALLVFAACTPQAAPAALRPAPGAAHEHPGAAGPCAAGQPPLGALPPALPAWCLALGPAVESALRGTNSWVDDFSSDATNARLASSYRTFESPRLGRTTVARSQHFAHNGHWMADVDGRGAPPGVYEGSIADFELGPNNGGALLRPDAGFRFADGRLVVEVEVAAGMTAYDDKAWPEIVVTTAPAPSRETNGWYAAGLFGGYATVGCGLPSDRLAECRIYDRDRITARLSAYSGAGASTSYGGAPITPGLAAAWRRCAEADRDELCRDRFRVELERDALTLYVNGVRYMEHRGLPEPARLPDELLRSTVYVYFASWAYVVEPAVLRFHWGRIAIGR